MSYKSASESFSFSTEFLSLTSATKVQSSFKSKLETVTFLFLSVSVTNLLIFTISLTLALLTVISNESLSTLYPFGTFIVTLYLPFGISP